MEEFKGGRKEKQDDSVKITIKVDARDSNVLVQVGSVFLCSEKGKKYC